MQCMQCKQCMHPWPSRAAQGVPLSPEGMACPDNFPVCLRGGPGAQSEPPPDSACT